MDYIATRIKYLVQGVLLLTLCGCTSMMEQSTETATNEVAARYNIQLAIAYLDQGNVSRAKLKMNKALAQGPKLPETYTAMAYFLERTGNAKAAEKEYHYALSLDTTRGETHNNYAAYLCRMRRYKEAEQEFLKAIADPQYTTVAQAYENAGLCSLAEGAPTKAQQYFEQALNNDPKRAESLLELAKLAYEKQNYEGANNYWRRYRVATEPSAEALLLAIKIAGALKDKDAQGSYVLQLKNNYAGSAEAEHLKTMELL